jgi:DnaJ-class molecular chaperone
LQDFLAAGAPCVACKGTGVIHPKKTCDACNGSGNIAGKKCNTCSGTGRVEKSNGHIITCPDCKGSGTETRKIDENSSIR